MKIGVFGGTFDPVHNGHLIISEYAADTFGLDRVLFVPVKIPVHKKIESSATPDERCEMVSIAVSGNVKFELSRIEIDRPEESYTIYTLNSLIGHYRPDDIYLIIGSDSFNSIDTWKEYQMILDMVNIAVIRRPGDDELRRDINVRPENFFSADNPLIGISSTAVRKLAADGRSLRYLVPDGVIEYISKKGLYKN